MHPERFHVVLSSEGRPVQHGWWSSEVVARGKFRDWVGEWGELPDARVTLTDEETGTELTTWPETT
ncbi:hypothetical protein [Streptomyces prasinus]|uniref:hypothetical protein n=1 Tax=Streptomyces prasinus TaxID=67345 RepID=UPI0033A8C3C1